MINILDMNISDSNTSTNLLSVIDSSPTISAIFAGLIILIIVYFWRNISIGFKFLLNKLFKKTEAFEVLNLRKHITLCANGHLIVLHDFRLKINDKNTTERFSRKFDISDGAKTCKLPVFKTMTETPKKDRFKTYGFWYRSSPDNIFEEVKEDSYGTNNNKSKNFYFRFNKNVLKNLKENVINLMYGYSVKNGQPLTNGYYDKTIANDENSPNAIESGFEVRYKMNTLEYVFSFIDDIKIIEDDIEVFYYPDGADNQHSKINIKATKKDDLYYNKFSFKIDKPKLNSIVKINVPIKHKEYN